MGKTGKWLRSLVSNSRKKKKTNFNFSSNNNNVVEVEDPLSSPYVDANKHAIAVAAAAAVVAETAIAAAQAAAEVVRLSSGTMYVSGDHRRFAAAVKIQSAFRAYLARRALRALKGLVKLQALVRGHFVRKQSADMLCRMQAMARIQARASSNRAYTTNSSKTKIHFSTSHQYYPTQFNSRPWNSNSDDERSDKILEIDTWKPHQNTKQHERPFPTSRYFSAWRNTGRNPSIYSEDVSSHVISPIMFPRVASSRPTTNVRGPFSTTRNECSRSLLGEYLGHHPSYMAYTESSRAKVRSQSAPKQRMELEKLGSSFKFGPSLWESDAISDKGSPQRGNNYLHPGHLKRQGPPTRGSGLAPHMATGFSDSYYPNSDYKFITGEV